MLTSDLTRARRRNGRIEPIPLTPKDRERLLPAAEHLALAAQECVGKTRAEFEAACAEAPARPTDYKIVKGLRKLIEDRCVFEAHFKSQRGAEPWELRRAVFSRAAEIRRNAETPDQFDADALLASTGAEFDLTPEEAETALFADLKQNHLLTQFKRIDAESLLDAYETGQKQAILLRAARVTIEFPKPDPGGARLFFRKLKFRRLLYTARQLEGGGYEVEIDGPFSLFRLTTAYGLQLALMLPVLDECGLWRLRADIVWKPNPKPYLFELEGGREFSAGRDNEPLADEVQQLKERFLQLESEWEVETARELLDMPGVGLCVPDLAFTRKGEPFRVYLEALGYWSREAVWRRVELAEAGMKEPVIFAFSSRLRVSEEALDEDLPSELLSYKGVVSAKAVLERLENMWARRKALPSASGFPPALE